MLNGLEGFYWVARCEGYASAARAFPYPITQPAVHQQVRKLEIELGCRLFERVAKARVQLTAAGRVLYDFCAPFFEDMPGVVRALRAGEFGGVLRMTSGTLVVRRLLPAWLRRLARARPDITVHVEEHSVPSLERVISGQADLLVDFVPALADGLASCQVGLAHTFLAIPAAHPAARRRLALRQLRDTPFVGYAPGTVHHALQHQALGQAGLTPPRGLAATNVDSILAFVRAGLGYSLIPWLDPRGPRVPGVVTRRQTGPGTTFPILAVWRAGSVPNPLVDAALGVASARETRATTSSPARRGRAGRARREASRGSRPPGPGGRRARPAR
jgi:DNA-binding transcriptional LysR family regulator